MIPEQYWKLLIIWNKLQHRCVWGQLWPAVVPALSLKTESSIKYFCFNFVNHSGNQFDIFSYFCLTTAEWLWNKSSPLELLWMGWFQFCTAVWMFAALTVRRHPDDGEEDLVLWRVLVQDAERRVSDDDPGVLLHVNTANWHHRLYIQDALQKGGKIACIMWPF